MSVRFITQNRGEFILFGKVLAETLRAHDSNRQWIISLQGDGESGKSLLALAADWQRNPHRYRIGIQRYHFVHKMAAHHHPEHYRGIFTPSEFAKMRARAVAGEEKIYFNDGLAQIRFHDGNYRAQWDAMLATMPNTKLIYLSNIRNWVELRTRRNAVEGQKIPIDMRLTVQVAEDEGFVRLLHYATGEKDLDKKIKAAYDAALAVANAQPPRPARRARRTPRPTPENE